MIPERAIIVPGSMYRGLQRASVLNQAAIMMQTQIHPLSGHAPSAIAGIAKLSVNRLPGEGENLLWGLLIVVLSSMVLVVIFQTTMPSAPQ